MFCYNNLVSVLVSDRETPTILIVDDDEGVTMTFARMLRLEGYEVYTAINAETGRSCRAAALVRAAQIRARDRGSRRINSYLSGIGSLRIGQRLQAQRRRMREAQHHRLSRRRSKPMFGRLAQD